MKKILAENMTVICNIQMMWSAMGILHDYKNFENLCDLTHDELHEKQNALVKEYNKYLREKQVPTKSDSKKQDVIDWIYDLETPQVLTDELKETIISSIEEIKEAK